MQCSLCRKDVKKDETAIKDPEWGWVHLKCQDRIPSPND